MSERITLDGGRGSRGVALVELDGRRIGSVRRFNTRWLGRLDSEDDYPIEGVGFRTRRDAAVDVAVRHLYSRSNTALLEGRDTDAAVLEAEARSLEDD